MGMENNYGISVIIACFYSGRIIEDTVQSILDNQCSYPFEIILVDDGTGTKDPERAQIARETHDALNTIQKLADEGYPIKIYRETQNRGSTAARNRAIHHTQYPIILPVDSDDLLTPPSEVPSGKGFLQHACEAFAQDPNLDVLASDIVLFGNGGTRVHAFDNTRSFDAKNFLKKCNLWICSAYTKDLALEAGGKEGVYDEKIRWADDFEFYTNLIAYKELNGQSLQVKRIPEALYKYRRYAPEPGKNMTSNFSHLDGYVEVLSRHPNLYLKNFSDNFRMSSQLEEDIWSLAIYFSYNDYYKNIQKGRYYEPEEGTSVPNEWSKNIQKDKSLPFIEAYPYAIFHQGLGKYNLQEITQRIQENAGRRIDLSPSNVGLGTSQHSSSKIGQTQTGDEPDSRPDHLPYIKQELAQQNT